MQSSHVSDQTSPESQLDFLFHLLLQITMSLIIDYCSSPFLSSVFFNHCIINCQLVGIQSWICFLVTTKVTILFYPILFCSHFRQHHRWLAEGHCWRDRGSTFTPVNPQCIKKINKRLMTG